jgi:hypothetical protein
LAILSTTKKTQKTRLPRLTFDNIIPAKQIR